MRSRCCQCFRRFRPNVASCALGAALLLASRSARAQTNWIVARSESVTNHIKGYAEVQPIAVLPVRAPVTGVVTGLTLLPGGSVRAGEQLGRLSGPEMHILLSENSNAVASARAQLKAAKKTLAVQRRKFTSHLSTQQDLADAESAAAQAKAELATAQSHLNGARQMSVLRAPTDGRLLAVNAADGERVRAGDPILTLQPTHRLWLRASFYGADAAAVRVGMTGEFSPSNGGGVVPIKVCTVFAALAPDGAESVGLIASKPNPGWLNGESGTVTLKRAARALVAIPTRALILDQGQWWVLVRTGQHVQRRRVTPGPSRGWKTFLKRGLAPGTEVVVENAYLEFHRSIARHYQPPD